MDDDADNPHIRIRTGGGNQILLNDVENMIYISNKSVFIREAWTTRPSDNFFLARIELSNYLNLYYFQCFVSSYFS